MTGISPYLKSFAKKTQCYCPLCEKEYFRTMEFTGNGIPRINCDRCKKAIERGAERDLDEITVIKHVNFSQYAK